MVEPESVLAHRAVIPPVSPGVERPLWSVMIPTYNGARYLRETLESVLVQDPGAHVMQIEVVDNASTVGDPEALVAEVGGGRVAFFRQPKNLHFIAHFQTCVRRSRGQLVHLLHDDDSVRPGFYEALQRGFERHPDAGAAFCRSIYVDPDGHWQGLTPLERPEPGVLEDWLWKIATGPRLTTPSFVVRRSVYEQLGGFDERPQKAGEDWEMQVRIATRYPVWYEPQPLAAYRVRRPGSLTDQAARNGMIAVDMRKAAEIIESYLPASLPAGEALRMTRFARQEFARWSVEGADQLLQAGRPAAAVARAREALRVSPSLKVGGWLLQALLVNGSRLGRRAGRRLRRGFKGARRS